MPVKLNACAQLLDAQVLVPADNMSMEIRVACGADLMSDVMAFACSSNEMMLTGLINPQAIRTAEMMDVKVVVFVRGKLPDQSMLDLAKDRSICVMTTQLPMFTACGLLYGAGIMGKGE
ncbi:MAG: hypothetical protein EOM13_07815 [Clostridia bacterium]|nr:hypothetical protein [Clostridia bacterium]